MSKNVNVPVAKIDTDPAKKSLKDLRNEIKLLKDQMVNLEEGSDAFLEAANKAGELKHQIDEINESVKGASSDFGDMVGNISNVAAGLTGAFSAVNGALQVMGVESKAIDESIKKMQGLIAVVQGLSSIDTAIKSLAKLQKSITSTTRAAQLLKAALTPKTFLVIAAAITALYYAFNKFKEAQDEAVRVQEEYNKKIREEKEARDSINRQQYLDDLKTELTIKERINKINSEGNNLEEAEANLKSYRQELAKLNFEYNAYKNGFYAVGEDPVLEANKRLKAISDLIDKIKETEANIVILKAEQNAQDELAARKAAERERIAQERKAKNGVSIGGVVQLEIQPIPVETTEEIGKKIGKIIAEAEIKARNEEWKKSIETIEQSGNAVFEGLKSTMSSFGDSSLGLTTGWIASLDQFQSAFKQTMDIVKNEGTVGWEAYGNVAATALGGIGTMLNALSQEQDVSTKEGFEQQKKLQISATVMNMLSGIMAAWTSSMALPAPFSFITGGIQTAATAALGAAQIAKIKSQTMDSAMASGAISPSTTAIASTIIPPVQYSSAVQGAQTEGAIKNTKVYVTESDITDTISKVQTQESENTY